MRTKEEGLTALRTVDAKFISETQKQAMLILQASVEELVHAIFDNVPEGADRTSAVRKLLECKMTCVQAITHEASWQKDLGVSHVGAGKSAGKKANQKEVSKNG